MVAGVISGRIAGNDVGFFCQQVNDTTLALVPIGRPPRLKLA
jgi:hypothetical protein